MKKTKSLIISAMIMVFALAFTACGSKSSSVEGSWSGNDNGYDVVFNFEADGQGTMLYAKELVNRFQAKSGATICKDLKGLESGKPLCECPDCVRNAVMALGEILEEQ